MTVTLPQEADRICGDWLADPLREYRGGDFFLSSPSGTLLARGTETIAVSAGTAMRALREAFAERRTALVAGAIPFEAERGAKLLGAASVLRGPQLRGRPSSTGCSFELALAPESRPGHYTDAVVQALERFAPDGLQKVVLARSRLASLPGPLNEAELLERLLAQNPSAFVFAAPLPGGRTLIGASPELLVRRAGTRAVSIPLAGSVALSGDPALDRERADALARSEKNLREHAIVVEMVAETLGRFCRRMRVSAAPELMRAGTMLHLASRIEGELIDLETTSLDLAFALHPTPAVCGWPTPAARAVIDELEGASRGYYAGAVGWSEASGDGEWAVSIRCAELGAGDVRIFAGAGIVSGSNPADELAETEAKLRTMFVALGAGEGA